VSYVNRPPRGQQRDKLYREALRLELAAAGEDLKKLREIAKVHIEKAAAGDMQAIKELADRLDGRPAQMLEHSDPSGAPIMRRELTYKIVHVTKTQEQIDSDHPGGLLIEHKPVDGNGHDSEHVMGSENRRGNGNGNGYG
jgi:hypothetical protein